MLSWFKKKKIECVGYISWYVSPYGQRRYLAKDLLEGNSYWYSPIKEDAHVFDSYDQAMLVTPKYDGSDNIQDRAGVAPVLK